MGISTELKLNISHRTVLTREEICEAIEGYMRHRDDRLQDGMPHIALTFRNGNADALVDSVEVVWGDLTQEPF